MNPENYKNVMKFRKFTLLILPFLAFNIVSGVAVAGIDAGKVKSMINRYIIHGHLWMEYSLIWINI